MLVMTGKIVMIDKVDITNSTNNETFQKVYLVIKKQMNKVKRNVCFESYGKVSNQILAFRKDERVRIFFTIDSLFNKGKWYHTLKIVEIEKDIKPKRVENINQNIIDYDTIKKSFE